ncbi:hypothetical protein OH77DRAFT_1428792 [Trametes cingulata]|nr:hypothetical protein OH77DRAFT_1428792 [Trametes cingulata]
MSSLKRKASAEDVPTSSAEQQMLLGEFDDSPSPLVAIRSRSDVIDKLIESERRTREGLPPPPVLKVTESGPPPDVCHAFEGKVAAQGFLQSLVITSPNMDYVPQYPVERGIVKLYVDGRWGLREYSRWPQVLVDNMVHVACIPREPSSVAPEILWHHLTSADWEEDSLTGVPGYGFIKESIRTKLVRAAKIAFTEWRQVLRKGGPSHLVCYRDHGNVLLLALRHAVDHIERLPSTRTICIHVAAHVQRICLELTGLCTYINVVVPRLTFPSEPPWPLLPVMGAFVQDPSAAQMCTSIGLPVWFLQPLTHYVKVWRVVEFQKPPADLAGDESDDAGRGGPPAFAALANLSGNWLQRMSLTVSKLVCAVTLQALASQQGEPGVLSTNPVPSAPKRAKTQEADPRGKHLQKDTNPPQKKTRRGRRQALKAAKRAVAEAEAERMTEDESQPQSQRDAVAASTGPAPNGQPPQPMKRFVLSPFYSVPEPWALALRRSSPVQSEEQALYFYPPPYLLDTVCSQMPLPPDAINPSAARTDEKVLRYLHNLVRIRRFCRTRLFDVTLTANPLSIGEWRASLWGDYTEKERYTDVPNKTAGMRRSQRRQKTANAIIRVFDRVAMIPHYREDMVGSIRGRDVGAKDIIADPSIRQLLLWESHEINFRCELMALDALLLQSGDWEDTHRWEREAQVSAVWGEPSSVISILPSDDFAGARDRWLAGSHPDWHTCRPYLVNFLRIMKRWPDFPETLLKHAAEAERWDGKRYDEVAREAASFYVKTFVGKYQRLPIPPIAPAF